MAAFANEAVSGRAPIDKAWTPPYVSTTGPAKRSPFHCNRWKMPHFSHARRGCRQPAGDEIKDVT
jgi:hypothetical protein